MPTKLFHIGDILSVTTGRLVSLDHIAGVVNVLDFMSGDSLHTHQLIIAAPIYRPVILQQLPDLNDVETPSEFVSDQSVYDWLDEQVIKFGAHQTLSSREDLWGSHNPIQDFIDIREGKYGEGV
jgi:hypothetical protein